MESSATEKRDPAAAWMPRPTEQHRRLAALEGVWTGEETLFPSPWLAEEARATGRFEARLALDGFFLSAWYEESRDGQVCFRGHGVYGWDERTRRYSMYWFDTMGGPGSSPTWGTWEGDTLAFENAGEAAGRQGRSRYSYRFDGPDALTFRIEGSQDGTTWTPFMEGRYTRTR